MDQKTQSMIILREREPMSSCGSTERKSIVVARKEGNRIGLNIKKVSISLVSL